MPSFHWKFNISGQNMSTNTSIVLNKTDNPTWDSNNNVNNKYIRFKNANNSLTNNEIVKINSVSETNDLVTLNISPQLEINSIDAAVIHTEYPHILMLFKDDQMWTYDINTNQRLTDPVTFGTGTSLFPEVTPPLIRAYRSNWKGFDSNDKDTYWELRLYSNNDYWKYEFDDPSVGTWKKVQSGTNVQVDTNNISILAETADGNTIFKNYDGINKVNIKSNNDQVYGPGTGTSTSFSIIKPFKDVPYDHDTACWAENNHEIYFFKDMNYYIHNKQTNTTGSAIVFGGTDGTNHFNGITSSAISAYSRINPTSGLFEIIIKYSDNGILAEKSFSSPTTVSTSLIPFNGVPHNHTASSTFDNNIYYFFTPSDFKVHIHNKSTNTTETHDFGKFGTHFTGNLHHNAIEITSAWVDDNKMWIHYQSIPRESIYEDGFLVSYNTNLVMVDGPWGSYLDTKDQNISHTTDVEIKHYVIKKNTYNDGDLVISDIVNGTKTVNYVLSSDNWGGTTSNYTGLSQDIISFSPVNANGTLFYVFTSDGKVSVINTQTKTVESNEQYGSSVLFNGVPIIHGASATFDYATYYFFSVNGTAAWIHNKSTNTTTEYISGTNGTHFTGIPSSSGIEIFEASCKIGTENIYIKYYTGNDVAYTGGKSVAEVGIKISTNTIVYGPSIISSTDYNATPTTSGDNNNNKGVYKTQSNSLEVKDTINNIEYYTIAFGSHWSGNNDEYKDPVNGHNGIYRFNLRIAEINAAQNGNDWVLAEVDTPTKRQAVSDHHKLFSDNLKTYIHSTYSPTANSININETVEVDGGWAGYGVGFNNIDKIYPGGGIWVGYTGDDNGNWFYHDGSDAKTNDANGSPWNGGTPPSTGTLGRMLGEGGPWGSDGGETIRFQGGSETNMEIFAMYQRTITKPNTNIASHVDGTWGGTESIYTGLNTNIHSIVPVNSTDNKFYVFQTDGNVGIIDTTSNTVESNEQYGSDGLYNGVPTDITAAAELSDTISIHIKAYEYWIHDSSTNTTIGPTAFGVGTSEMVEIPTGLIITEIRAFPSENRIDVVYDNNDIYTYKVNINGSTVTIAHITNYPSIGTPVATSDGFTVQISNYDISTKSWSISASDNVNIEIVARLKQFDDNENGPSTWSTIDELQSDVELDPINITDRGGLKYIRTIKITGFNTLNINSTILSITSTLLSTNELYTSTVTGTNDINNNIQFAGLPYNIDTAFSFADNTAWFCKGSNLYYYDGDSITSAIPYGNGTEYFTGMEPNYTFHHAVCCFKDRNEGNGNYRAFFARTTNGNTTEDRQERWFPDNQPHGSKICPTRFNPFGENNTLTNSAWHANYYSGILNVDTACSRSETNTTGAIHTWGFKDNQYKSHIASNSILPDNYVNYGGIGEPFEGAPTNIDACYTDDNQIYFFKDGKQWISNFAGTQVTGPVNYNNIIPVAGSTYELSNHAITSQRQTSYYQTVELYSDNGIDKLKYSVFSTTNGLVTQFDSAYGSGTSLLPNIPALNSIASVITDHQTNTTGIINVLGTDGTLYKFSVIATKAIHTDTITTYGTTTNFTEVYPTLPNDVEVDAAYYDKINNISHAFIGNTHYVLNSETLTVVSSNTLDDSIGTPLPTDLMSLNTFQQAVIDGNNTSQGYFNIIDTSEIPQYIITNTTIDDNLSIYTDTLITLNTSLDDSIIYYTIDNSEPTNTSAQYTGPFRITFDIANAHGFENDLHLKFVAHGGTYLTSTIGTISYNINDFILKPEYLLIDSPDVQVNSRFLTWRALSLANRKITSYNMSGLLANDNNKVSNWKIIKKRLRKSIELNEIENGDIIRFMRGNTETEITPSIYYNETATSQPVSVNDLVEHILISGNSFYIPLDDDIDSEYWCKLTLGNESKLIKFQYLSNTYVYSYHILDNSLNIVSSSDITESITLEFNNVGYVLFTGGIGGENNSLPQITSFTLTPEFPLPTDILTATLTASDADGDQIDLNIIWCINGVEISNNIDTNAIEERSYQLDLNTLPAITESDVITLKVIPNDGLSDGAIGYESVSIKFNILKIDDVISIFNCAISQIRTECDRLIALERILCMREQLMNKLKM
jgi:hypothetical protein